MNSINRIQPNNIFKVNPVALFENRQQGGANPFDSGIFSKQTNENFNLNHPKVAGSEFQAKNLDFLA